MNTDITTANSIKLRKMYNHFKFSRIEISAFGRMCDNMAAGIGKNEPMLPLTIGFGLDD